jgi:hypothetical protein
VIEGQVFYWKSLLQSMQVPIGTVFQILFLAPFHESMTAGIREGMAFMMRSLGRRRLLDLFDIQPKSGGPIN